jgi:hypothetical protein
MELRKATADDNKKLIEYFKKFILPGPVLLRLNRIDDFFKLYAMQSDDYVTYMLLNKKGDIEALASMVFFEALLDGKEETIGFASDLRVSPTRRAIMEWSSHFLPVLEAERTSRKVKYIFSVVAGAQRQAYNAFIRPRSLKRNLPRYHLFRKFSLITMHGLWPFHSRPLPSIHISEATNKDWSVIYEYIALKSRQKQLNLYKNSQTVEEHIKRWPNLDASNFLLAKDSQGCVIGCTAMWSSNSIQQAFVDKYTPTAENMRDVLGLFSYLGLAHRLPKPKNELNLTHLPFLNADNPDIFRSLLYEAFQKSEKNSVLLYPHFEDDLLMVPPKRFITAKMNYGLYCILSPNDPIPSFLRPHFPNPPPTFETPFI